MFKFNNASPADFIADSLSAVLTAAVKHFIVDRGIEYARTKVDDLLAPPEIDEVVEGEVVEEKEVKNASTKSTGANRNGNSAKKKQGSK